MKEPTSKGERTSQAIVEAAYSLFVEQGFHGTSMRQIARRAGVALGGIYNHFVSKEAIFDHVLLEKHPYRHILAVLQATTGDTVEDFVRNAAQTLAQLIDSNPEFLKLVFVEITEFKGQHAPRLFQTIFPQFIPLIERFQGVNGQLRDIPVPSIMYSFLGTFFSHYLARLVLNPEEKRPAIQLPIEPQIDILLHGILKPEAP